MQTVAHEIKYSLVNSFVSANRLQFLLRKLQDHAKDQKGLL